MDEKSEVAEEILERIVEVTGTTMPGVKGILRLLAHPDVIEHTKRYFDIADVASRCQKYQDPWNCAREAEAQYENIKYGWLGAANGVGYSEWWCENCRKKVMGG